MKKKQIFFVIALVIIIIGIIMQLTLGFNLGFEYGGYSRVTVSMKQATNIEDIKQLINEIFDGNYRIEYTDEFSDTILIKAKGLSDEKLAQIQDKLKEKYEFKDEDANRIVINYIPNIEVFDLIKDYILPILLSFGIIIAYFAITFRKLGVYKSLIEPVITVILIGGIYVSLLVICRIPLNAYIIPLGIFIYIVSLLGFTICLSKKSKELIVEKKK